MKRPSGWTGLTLAASLLLVVMLMPASVQAQDVRTITFNDAVRIALEQNILLERSANAVELQSVVVSQRRANFLPNLNLSSSGSQSYGRTFSQEDLNFVNETTESFRISTSSGINLFNGFGDVSALQQARLQRDAGELTYERQRQSVVFTVMNDYLNLISQTEQVHIREENLEASRQLMSQIEEMVRVGTRPMSDLFQQQATVANAELLLLQAQRAVQLAEVSLIQTLQLDPFGEYRFMVPEVEETRLVQTEYNVQQMLNAAFENRYDLQAQQYSIQAAEEGIRGAKSSYWPSIGLSFGYGTGWNSRFFDETATVFDQFNQQRGGSVSLSLSMPIFDRFATRNSVQQARLQYENTRLDLENLEQDIALQVRQAYLDYLTDEKQLDVTAAQLRAAEQALEAEQERYNVGAATLVELTQARASYVQAQSDRASAVYSFIFRKNLIEYYVGRLNPTQTLFE